MILTRNNNNMIPLYHNKLSPNINNNRFFLRHHFKKNSNTLTKNPKIRWKLQDSNVNLNIKIETLRQNTSEY